MDWGALIGAIGGLLGESGGKIAQDQSADRQYQMMYDILNRIKEVPLPELERMVAEQLGRPEAAEADPQALAAQRAALSRFGTIAEGGVTPEEKAAEAEIQSAANQRDRQAREAILGQASRMGTLGSGAALAEQIGAQSKSSQQAHDDAMKLAASHYRNSLNALMNQANLAGSMNQQRFQRGSAADAVAAANAAARTSANRYNLGLPQANYMNAMEKIGMMANPSRQIGDWYGQKGQRDANFWGTVGQQAGAAGKEGWDYYKKMSGSKKEDAGTDSTEGINSSGGVGDSPYGPSQYDYNLDDENTI